MVKASHAFSDDYLSMEKGCRVQGGSNVRSLTASTTGNPENVHQLSALTTLIEPRSTTDDASPSVNIVFVHSLGSSTRRCWTNAGMFWPISLHNVNGLQNARIMTFDYDTLSVKSLSDLAEQLLFGLSNHHSSCGPVSLVFLELKRL